MATSIKKWKPYIFPDILESSFPSVEFAVREAAIEFCEETLLWSEDLTAINVVAATASYTLSPPSLSRLVAIDSVHHKATGAANSAYDPLDPIPQEHKDLVSTTAWRYDSGTPTGYYHNEEITPLFLHPIPDTNATSGLLVRVHLIPSEDCTTLEDFLWNQYQDVLTAGAKGLLFSQKAMPWYDTTEATAQRQKFIQFMDGVLRKMGRKYIPKVDKEARPKL